MAIYSISDLHLGISSNKPMDIFGPRWANYLQLLEENWQKTVGPDDIVLVPGDISWAMYISEAEEDFRFLDRLNGIKLISKGNHDYWWETLSKLKKYVEEKGFSTIRFMHNN
ncbi:MAG: metallophosphoesterase, partial [Clostridia bacterium]|nr:metallophosphoesterase [Clostridia bacterium]